MYSSHASTPDRRLRDYTAELLDMQHRSAALLTAVALQQRVHIDPELLSMFFEARHVSPPLQVLVKAAVAAMDVASNLAPARPMMSAFLAAVDRQSVLGQLNAVKVPSTNVAGAAQTAGASANWIGEQVAKPISALAFAALALPPRKLAADVAVTEELLRFAITDTLSLVERSVVSACASALDTALLDPANAGTASVKPASLTNGLTPIVGSGSIDNQVGQALAAISGGAPTRPAVVVNIQAGARLAALPGLSAFVNVITSPALTATQLVAIDADGVCYVDDGGRLAIGQPDVQMDSAPTSPSTAATVMVSSWQRNQQVVRCERWTNWAKRPDAVALLTLA